MTKMTRYVLFILLMVFIAVPAVAQDEALPPLDSDTEPDRIEWWQLEETFGALPEFEEGVRVGQSLKRSSTNIGVCWGMAIKTRRTFTGWT